MDKEDWLRVNLLRVAPTENKRMREKARMGNSDDYMTMLHRGQKNGATGGRPRKTSTVATEGAER
jgi:hypothetical protein